MGTGQGVLLAILLLGAVAIYAIVVKPGVALVIVGALVGAAYIVASLVGFGLVVDTGAGILGSILIMGMGSIAMRIERLADALAPSTFDRQYADLRARMTAPPPPDQEPDFAPESRGTYRGIKYVVTKQGYIRTILGEFLDADAFRRSFDK